MEWLTILGPMARLLTAIWAVLVLTACTGALPLAAPASVQAKATCAAADPEPAAADEPLTLTVATYNVLGGPPPPEWFPEIDPAELDPLVREPAAVALIEHLEADVLGLQEYRPEGESGARMAADLGQYTWVAPESDNPEAVALPILFRTDRFDCLANGGQKVTSVGEDGSMLDRYVTWAELRDHDSGRRFFVFNYHAHPWQTDDFAAIRSTAVGRIIDVLEQVNPGLAEPFVITGDFNARNNDTRKVYRDHVRKLGERGILDAATIAAKDASDIPHANSMNKMSAKVGGEYVGKAIRRNGQHIDYVWVPEGTRVRSWAVVSGPNATWRTIDGRKVPVWTGIIPSDHSPVVAKVRFPRAG